MIIQIRSDPGTNESFIQPDENSVWLLFKQYVSPHDGFFFVSLIHLMPRGIQCDVMRILLTRILSLRLSSSTTFDGVNLHHFSEFLAPSSESQSH